MSLCAPWGCALARHISWGMCRKATLKVVYSGDRCYFLYLATWNIPRMFRNVKNLWKNVT